MSKKRIVPILLIAALSLALALPAAAADDQAEASWADAVIELVEEVVDFIVPDDPENYEGDDENLPSVLPVIDPDG